MIEHGDAVGGEPDVALLAGRAEPQCQLERFDGVLGGVGSGATMGKGDRRVEQGGETLLHSVS